MSSPQNDHGYWLGWYFAYGVLALVFIVAVWKGQFDNLCTASEPAWLPWAQPEEHCLREWLSAVAGWFGLIVGVPSILFLARQVRLSEISSASLAESERRRQIAACYGVLRICSRIERSLDPERDWMKPTEGQTTYQQACDAQYMLTRFIDLITDPAVDYFEAHFFTGGLEAIDAGEARRELQREIRFLNNHVDDDEETTVLSTVEIAAIFNATAEILRGFCTNMSSAASAGISSVHESTKSRLI